MASDLDIFNDPDVILAQTASGIIPPLVFTPFVSAGAIGSLGGATGTIITVTSSGASGFTISPAGSPGNLQLSVVISSASTARTGLGIDDIATKQSNLSAGAAPTVNDDSSAGYAVGSFWIDVAADDGYWCMDATVGAAVWKKITP
jgi:hypothetical protein